MAYITKEQNKKVDIWWCVRNAYHYRIHLVLVGDVERISKLNERSTGLIFHFAECKTQNELFSPIPLRTFLFHPQNTQYI